MQLGLSVAFGAALFGLVHAVAVAAVPIAGLVNTGAVSSGGLLDDGVQDNSYVLSGTGTGLSGSNGWGYAQTSVSQWPIDPQGPWLGDNDTSRWLTPQLNAAASFDTAADGTYIWTLKFDLSGYLADSASFSGRWAADNGGTVSLNGNLLNTITVGPGSSSFDTWTNFGAASSAFIAGVNTLVFSVTNLKWPSGNPTGLRVEFQQSAVTAVPEPETYALMLAGLGVIGFVARRRRIG